MRIVIDANRVLASLIRDGTTRAILLDPLFEFFAPDGLMTEIGKHADRVTKASGLRKEELEILLLLLSENITVVPREEYVEYVEKIRGSIGDPGDVPYVAVCLAVGAEGIWTHDPHFRKQDEVQVFTNIDMLRKSGKAMP
jgi:predicted nucleic acid-binding protein